MTPDDLAFLQRALLYCLTFALLAVLAPGLSGLVSLVLDVLAERHARPKPPAGPFGPRCRCWRPSPDGGWRHRTIPPPGLVSVIHLLSTAWNYCPLCGRRRRWPR